MDPDNTLESPRGVYEIVKKLGSGAVGDVYLTDYIAKNTLNSEQVALKKIALYGMSEKEKRKREADLMKTISESSINQHIVKYFDSFITPSRGYLYIAMDYCSRGDLISKIKENVRSIKQFNPKIIYDYIYQIADGISELHKHNIVHRDLKPANILITLENGKEVLKISDFGLAKVIDTQNKNLQHTRCGTWFYMAPEQYSGRYQSPVDIWAIGIIFYELCIAPKRLQENEMANLRTRVDNGQRVTLPNQYLAADTKWLNNMIAKDRYKRMSSRQVRDEAKGRNNLAQSNSKENTLFYLWYQNNNKSEGRICLFNSDIFLVENIAKFDNYYAPNQVATTQNKIFGIDDEKKSFEIYDLSTGQISRGPNPPEWRDYASVAYFKDKLYYLGGWDSKAKKNTNRVDVLIDGQWQTGPAFPLQIKAAQAITCDEILYVIDGFYNGKIYRLSDDEREWIEVGEIPEEQYTFGVASLNGRIYIAGGCKLEGRASHSCLCFDPSAPVDSRTSQIADMNYDRRDHSLIAANEKLYAIGGFQEIQGSICNSIEEYDSQANKWREVGEFVEPIESDIEKSRKLNELCPQIREINPRESSERASSDKANRNLVIKSAQLYDADIAMPLDALTLADMQQFESHLNKMVIMVHVFVKLSIENSSEDEAFKLEVADGTKVMELISEAMAKVNWTGRRLKVQTVKLFNTATKGYDDISQSYESLLVSDEQKYEFRLKNEESSNGVIANVIINGTTHQGLLFNLPVEATVQDLVDAVFVKFNPASANRAINSVKIYDSKFDDWESIAKPYSKKAIEFDRKYSVAISCKEAEIPPNMNSPEKFDQVSSPRAFGMLNSSPAAESGQRDMAHTKPSPTQSSIITEPIVKLASNQNNSTFAQIPQGETLTHQALGQIAQLGDLYDAYSEKPDQVSSPRTATMLNFSPAVESGQRDMAHTKPSPTQSSIAIASNQSDLTFAQIPKGKTITRQALGRIAMVGDLYDAHTDCFCGRALFNSDLPENAIKLTDTQRIVCDYVMQDSINDKFNKLDVEAELKASILGGMIKVSGHGKYLSTNTFSAARETSAALVCKMTTKHEAVKIDNKEIVSLLSPNAVRSTPNATHVVVAIQWGAVATATLKCSNEENEDKTKVEAALKAKLACLKIDGAGYGSVNDTSTRKSRDFRLEFFIDALPNGDDVPQTVEQAVFFMKKLPALVANANGGKGTPICYTLLPLSAFKHYLGAIDSLNKIIKSINENAIEEAVHIFDEMNQSQRELNDIHGDFQKYSFCITDDAVQSVFKLLQLIRTAQTNIKEQLRKAIVDIRHGRSDVQAIFSIVRDYNKQPASRAAVDAFINSLMPLREKIDYAEYIQKKGAYYIGKGMSLESERMKHNPSECYIFFCSWSQSQGLADNKRYFNSLIEEKKFACFLVDIDSQPDMSKREGVGDGNRICLFSNGEYISNDCFRDYLEDRKKCLAQCIQQRTKTTEKTNKRVDVDLICPRSLEGRYCSKDANEWFCADCRERLQYDFNQNFLCDCGSASIKTFQFRCSDPKHGANFLGFSDNNYLTDLVNQIRPYKEINILILGETGVGKSTWINGFANYLTFQTLKEAEKGKQIYLVPSKFTLTDSKYKMKTIKVGESENESFLVRESSTQEPKSYVFTVGKKTVRLINTPGIGDCRGAEQDKKNFSSILRYIARFSEIHGVCILLKPNNSRLNILFNYCISELLTHLHVSAAKNIAFCFTNARPTFYRPGDTLPVLTEYLGDLKADRGVEIVANKETIYCMDNESFRFLCCLHEKEPFTERHHENFEQSWKLSVEETGRLLNHFEKDVDPHIVEQTVSLNKAREFVLTLAKPLATISQNIQDSILVARREINISRELEWKIKDLYENRMILKIGLKMNQLGYPRTVCTGVNCIGTQVLPDLGVTKTIYKICHDPCHCCLGNVIPETVPNSALQKCQAIDPSSLKCKNCGCSWMLHMRITFTQEKIEMEVEDPVVKQKLQQCKDSRDQQEIFIGSLNDRIEKYKKEQKTINEICAKLAAFLREHSILPYNDAIEDYLKFDIGELERQGNNTRSLETLQKVERLKEQLRQYQETKRVLDKNMKSPAARKIEAAEIKMMQKHLEHLELTGKQIKELFDATVCGQQTYFKYTESYFDDSKHRKKNNKPYVPNQDNF